MQQSQQSMQIGSVSQPQTFHHLTTAQGAMHQTIQYGVAPSMMTQGADQQTIHQQTTQAVMAHAAGQPTIQLGMGQSLLAHGVGQQTIQGLVAQGGSMFGGAQIICASDPSNNNQVSCSQPTARVCLYLLEVCVSRALGVEWLHLASIICTPYILENKSLSGVSHRLAFGLIRW